MVKTFTLPKDLQNQLSSLKTLDSCELIYQSQMLTELEEEFENVSLSPKQSTIDHILAYSKAVEVKRSETMLSDHVVMLN